MPGVLPPVETRQTASLREIGCPFRFSRWSLPLNANLRKRQHRRPRRRPSHRKRRMERSKNQQVLQLRQHRLGVVRLRQDAVILHAAIGIHVGFNHHRVVAHIAERRAEGGLFELRPGVQHKRNVSAAGLQFCRQGKEAQQQTESQHGAEQSRRSRNHEGVKRVFEPHQRTFKPRTTRLRGLARNRKTQLQRQIGRGLFRTQTGKQLLRALHRGIFPLATSALCHVARECAHLRPAHPAIEIRREQPFRLSAVHGVTSTSLPPREPSREFSRKLSLELWVAPFCRSSTGATSPNSGPTSRTYPVNFLRSASRPRVMRDFTVPSEITNTSAISSYDISSRSRRINAARYGSGTCCSACSTAARTSVCANFSNGDSPGSTSRSSPEHSNSPVAMGSIGVSCALCRNHQRLRLAASCSAMR